MVGESRSRPSGRMPNTQLVAIILPHTMRGVKTTRLVGLSRLRLGQEELLIPTLKGCPHVAPKQVKEHGEPRHDYR